MKRVAMLLLVVAGSMMTGCARPGEMGYGVAYTAEERHRQIARNWDFEGKQLQDDLDHLFLLRPMTNLSIWNLR